MTPHRCDLCGEPFVEPNEVEKLNAIRGKALGLHASLHAVAVAEFWGPRLTGVHEAIHAVLLALNIYPEEYHAKEITIREAVS